MATGAFTSAGTRFGITATAPATFDAAGYGALSFTDIGDIVDGGSVGKTYNVTNHNPVGDRATYKIKGSYNNGTQTLQGAKVPDDPGQIIVLQAVDSDADFYFSVELNDNPDGLTNTFLYYSAIVTSAPTNIGGVDSITDTTYTVDISGDVIEVAKTDA